MVLDSNELLCLFCSFPLMTMVFLDLKLPVNMVFFVFSAVKGSIAIPVGRVRVIVPLVLVRVNVLH